MADGGAVGFHLNAGNGIAQMKGHLSRLGKPIVDARQCESRRRAFSVNEGPDLASPIPEFSFRKPGATLGTPLAVRF